MYTGRDRWWRYSGYRSKFADFRWISQPDLLILQQYFTFLQNNPAARSTLQSYLTKTDGQGSLSDYNILLNVGNTSGIVSRSQSNSTGNGGNITVSSPNLNIQQGALITVNSNGTGRGGNITANADTMRLDRQYLTSGAYLPTGQTLSIDGAGVRIQIVEGKLEDIQVTGTQRLNPEYIRSRLALATRQPLNNDRLIEGLRLLQQDPLIGSIAAELSSGIQPGTNSRIIEEPYRLLDLTTNSRYAEVSVRQPLIRRARQDSTQEFAISLTG